MERKKIVLNRRRYNKLKAVTSAVAKRLALVFTNSFDAELLQAVNSTDEIECAYILDEKGIQSSSTVFSDSISEIKQNRLFSPAKIGTDHSMKIYYRYLKSANTRRFITESYASLATGNLCITFANAFQDMQKKKYIVCIDFKVTE